MRRLQVVWHWPVYIRREGPFREPGYYGLRSDSIEYRIVLSFDRGFFRRFRFRADQWPAPVGADGRVWLRSWAFGPLEIRKFLP